MLALFAGSLDAERGSAGREADIGRDIDADMGRDMDADMGRDGPSTGVEAAEAYAVVG